ncbi:MAG: hypothetical protein J1E34_07415 [Oscillospiraceae bacterium]|nr:hypothetical protein [Oscillospiraceae bacterium]
MNNDIGSYVNSFIPPSLSKTKKKELYDELMCHLLDKADRYEEIGYSNEDSIKKAIDDFGTDETVKGAISAEFERLYHEKTWWALIPAAVILLMNASWLFFLISSGEDELEHNLLTAFISFIMIFVCFGFIFFARVKLYRKMLVGTAVANLLVSPIYIWCLYPQSALYAIEHNIYLLIDKLTPFTVPPQGFYWCFYACVIFTLLIAVYCVIAAILIKKDRARKINDPRKKAVILGVCYSAAAVLSCILMPEAVAFSRDYPIFFDYNIYASEESEALYNMIELNTPYSDAANKLRTEGWVEISDYEKSLDRNTRKKFRYQCKELNFGEEYKVFFCPVLNNRNDGNGFVFLKADDTGAVISKGIGDLNPLDRKEDGFRFSGWYNRERDNMTALFADFKSLKKGSLSTSVMDRFGKNYGTIYSHFESVTGGKHIERFVIYAYGITDSEANIRDRCNPCHIELTFSDGLLTWGRMLVAERDGAKYIHTETTIR